MREIEDRLAQISFQEQGYNYVLVTIVVFIVIVLILGCLLYYARRIKVAIGVGSEMYEGSGKGNASDIAIGALKGANVPLLNMEPT